MTRELVAAATLIVTASAPLAHAGERRFSMSVGASDAIRGGPSGAVESALWAAGLSEPDCFLC